MNQKTSQNTKNFNWKTCFIWTTAALSTVIVVLAAALVGNIFSRSNSMEAGKLEVFDELARNYVGTLDIITDEKTLNQATGYGISDEDGVFYITFDFTALDDEYMPKGDLRHGIVYFWKDQERGTYSFAYSYPDSTDDHPGGAYYKLGL